MTKLFATKAYEKVEMLKRNPDAISVMIAKDDDEGTYCIVLTVDSVPIAEILREADAGMRLSPQFEESELLQKVFEDAALLDPDRQSPSDFNRLEPQVEEFIDRSIDGALHIIGID